MLRTVRSVADLDAAIVANIHRIPRDVDAVVGIPRSGLLAASMVALHLQLPLADVEGFCRHQVVHRARRLIDAERILLVDDTVLTGRAMRMAVERIRSARPDATIVRMAVWSAPKTPAGAVDLALGLCPTPRAFAWNLWKHKRLTRWVFDLDGVLCRDPSSAENDDGPAYARFIDNVEPRFLPQRPVGWIMTARLEKYRAPTEAWLQRHGVEYTALIMLDLPDKAARIEQGNRGRWKGERYAELGDAELFVESDRRQVRKIVRHSGKPAWCTDTQTFVTPETLETDSVSVRSTGFCE